MAASPFIDIGVGLLEWTRYKEIAQRNIPYTLLADVGSNAAADLSSGGEILQQLAQLDSLGKEAAEEILLKYLFQFTARILQIDSAKRSELEPEFVHVRLNALGLDSLMAVELRNRILADLSVDVPVSYFIGTSTVNEMIGMLRQQIGNTQQRTGAVPATAEMGAEVVS